MSDGLLPVRLANLFQPQKRCWVRGLSVYCRFLKLWSFDCDPIQLQKFHVCSISVHCIPVDFDSFAHDVSLTRLGPSGDEAE